VSGKSIAQKLFIKDNYRILLLNAPEDFISKLGELPQNVTLLTQATEPVDFIQVFVTSKKELETILENVKSMLKPEGLLWVSYPKGTSGIKVDINRDKIWQFAQTVGFKAVSMIAIDETWSAMRLKLIQ